MAYLLVACQALLLMVFVTSAAGKATSHAAWSGFVGSVRALRLVPEPLVRTVAIAVVAAELGVALLLVPAWTAPAGLILAGVLLTIFTWSVVVTLRRGITAACRCFGPSALPLGRRHLVRNGLLIAVVTLAAWSSASTPPAPRPAGIAVTVLASLIGATVLVFFDEIVELFADPATAPGHEERST